MACTTCRASEVVLASGVAKAEAQVADIEKSLKGRFGPISNGAKNVVIVPKHEMRERAVDVLVEQHRKKYGLTAEEEPVVRGILRKSVGSPRAFQHGDTVYIAPGAPPSVVGHETTHAAAHEHFDEWLKEQVPEYADTDRRHDFVEAMTEYFNRQLPTGGAMDGRDYTDPTIAAYTHGPNIIRAERDRLLGGERGEHLLADCYFRGDCAPLQNALESRGVAPSAFIKSVSDRAKKMAHGR